jgi:hypothetical protein
MRVLREFPELEAPLRDGRLSLTTAVTLRPVLTRENLDEMVARAAFKTDEETRHLVASLQPRPAPREGIRRLPAPAADVTANAPEPAEAPAAEPAPFALAPPLRPPSRPSLDPVSADQWSVRFTADAPVAAGDPDGCKCSRRRERTTGEQRCGVGRWATDRRAVNRSGRRRRSVTR